MCDISAQEMILTPAVFKLIIYFKMQVTQSPVYDIMSVLLEWICDAHLRQSITDQPTQPAEKFCTSDYLQEKVLRVSPFNLFFTCLLNIMDSSAVLYSVRLLLVILFFYFSHKIIHSALHLYILQDFCRSYYFKYFSH